MAQWLPFLTTVSRRNSGCVILKPREVSLRGWTADFRMPGVQIVPRVDYLLREIYGVTTPKGNRPNRTFRVGPGMGSLIATWTPQPLKMRGLHSHISLRGIPVIAVVQVTSIYDRRIASKVGPRNESANQG